MAITLTDNEFFAGLTNLALYMRLYSTVNSSKPKDFVDKFATDTLEYGNTKIFPYADMPSVSDYSETSSLLSVTKVNTGEEILQVNDKKVIKSSYSKKILDQAFTDESGMNMFVGYLIGQMDAAKTDYLYDKIYYALADQASQDTQNLHVGYYHNIYLKEINYSTDTAAEINAKELYNNKKLAKELNNLIDNIQIFTNIYNKKRIKEALDLSDLRLIMGGKFDTDQVVEVFASMLNSDYITKSFEKPEKLVFPTSKPLNKDMIGKNEIFGIVCHKRWYQFFYKFIFMGNFFDVSNLVVNNFLHFWTGDGFLEHLPCVVIQVVYQ